MNQKEQLYFTLSPSGKMSVSFAVVAGSWLRATVVGGLCGECTVGCGWRCSVLLEGLGNVRTISPASEWARETEKSPTQNTSEHVSFHYYRIVFFFFKSIGLTEGIGPFFLDNELTSEVTWFYSRVCHKCGNSSYCKFYNLLKFTWT